MNRSRSWKTCSRFHPWPISVAVLACLTCCIPVPSVFAQSHNITVLSQVHDYEAYSDIWGYTSPGGVELAIIGTSTGTSFVDVTDPTAPIERGFIEGPLSCCRDIKTYGHYAYVGAEVVEFGLQIIDLQNPFAPSLVGTYDMFVATHNVWIDTERGWLFASGTSQGLQILDLSIDPENPIPLSDSGQSVHDLYTRDGVAYLASIGRGALVTHDLTALPGSFPELDAVPTESRACHNVWLTDDGDFAVTTDEVPAGHLTVFDVSDPTNMFQVGAWENPDDPTSTVHNVYIRDDLAVAAWYKSGVHVVDVALPNHPQRVAHIDLFPGSGPGSSGTWGVYVGAPSGLIYASDINSGLFILRIDPNWAVVEGVVTDALSSQPIEGVVVSLDSFGIAMNTDATGRFRFDLLEEAPSTLRFEHYAYEDLEVEIDFEFGTVNDLSNALARLPDGSLSGLVVDEDVLQPIAGALVEVVGTPLTTVSMGDGSYEISAVPIGNWILRGRAFGFGASDLSVSIVEGVNTEEVQLPISTFVDDFENSSGWTVGASGDDATGGVWDQVDPRGTGGGLINPEHDHTPAPGVLCFVTGNGSEGGGIGEADVDDGTTTLVSPVFDLSGTDQPIARYHLWYVNDGSAVVDDVFRVEVSSDGGGGWVLVDEIAESDPIWSERYILLTNHVAATSEVQIRFVASDLGGASIVEAGIDDFEIYDGGSSVDVPGGEPGHDPKGALETSGVLRAMSIGPNPVQVGTTATLHFALVSDAFVDMDLVDVSGRVVRSWAGRKVPAGDHELAWDGTDMHGESVRAGVYFHRIRVGAVEAAIKVVVAN